ncbi:dihydroxyacetone kinase subunit DhaL [Propionimicrobium sp. PCR01-08-3]|uniref:dihydroxyacetone kinase subunit DhaL n=1 Tax=Propionimicrobium sp. PCR01-08-3 TaxID=3052086 RepID=UPI00255C8DB0|nr:dihydroxyacetone kinase subunit DhaL [Propionimicrobium sp. PCR01-08-3]WIY81437.1 dihydroxyacetone kinase subunit DhaL [Propionimicrobium sp. PCR01-08-3]
MSEPLVLTEYVVKTIAQTAIDNEKYFCDLDSVVGDGDFGYSLARGFEKVLEQWDDFDRSSVAVFLQKVAMVVTSRVGGTSGPIWGTAFLRASMVAKKTDVFDDATAVAMLRSAAEGIMARGGASLGEKTLLDALVPMTDTLEHKLAEDLPIGQVLDDTAARAVEAAEATSKLEAKRGRAAYTGERSIGSVDAGATAIGVLASAVAKDWPDR